MKSYNTSIKVSLRHLTYWGILGKGVAATPNVSKGLSNAQQNNCISLSIFHFHIAHVIVYFMLLLHIYDLYCN